MCDDRGIERSDTRAMTTVPVGDAVGMVLAHDITEIRKDEFKGVAFKKGHIIRVEDVTHLKRLGKEHLYVLLMAPDEMHENDAAAALASALMGRGVRAEGEPREGKINIVAERDGLLKINREALLSLNMLGEVMCATRHGNTLVRAGRVVAGTRAIPLVVKKAVIDEAVRIAESVRQDAGTGGQGDGETTTREANSPSRRVTASPRLTGVIEVKELRKPRAGVVITGNEVYHGRIKDAFAPVITKKIESFGGEIVGLYYAPDDAVFIEQRLRELRAAGADLLITTGGMSVDPDDVTRFAIRSLGAVDVTYGAAVLPGAMFLIGYLPNAECGMRNAEFKEDSTQNAESPKISGQVSMPNGELEKREATQSHSEFRIPHSALVPVLGIPACGMYHAVTVLDLVLPRVLAGEKIGRRELAELGYGGLCLHCKECRYPVCPFGK